MSISTPLEQYVTAPSHLDSQFSEQPGFPTIRQIPNASWPTVLDGSTIPAVPYLSLNKIYFSKKVYNQTLKTYDPNGYADTARVIWEIPFSVDVNEPVTELTQKIQAVMVAKKIYKHWDINFSNFTILAVEETTELDSINNWMR
jgi:hypothetical protein